MSRKPTSPEQTERDARLAEALRANLKRRKAAARKDSAPEPGKSKDSEA